jgi:hypothetical protein
MDQFGSGRQVIAVTTEQEVCDEKGDLGRGAKVEVKIKIKVKIKVKIDTNTNGVGQECPTHICSPDSADVLPHHGLGWFAVEGFAELGHV